MSCIHSVIYSVLNVQTYSYIFSCCIWCSEAGGSEGSVAGKSSEFGYESHCSSDGMRITKSQKVYGLAVCPVTEMKAAVVTSEGKLLVWELSPVSVSLFII